MIIALDCAGSEIRVGDVVTSLRNPSNFGTVEAIEAGGELQPGPVVAFRYAGPMLLNDSDRPIIRVSAAGLIVTPDSSRRD